jgi:Ubiquitin family
LPSRAKRWLTAHYRTTAEAVADFGDAELCVYILPHTKALRRRFGDERKVCADVGTTIDSLKQQAGFDPSMEITGAWDYNLLEGTRTLGSHQIWPNSVLGVRTCAFVIHVKEVGERWPRRFCVKSDTRIQEIYRMLWASEKRRLTYRGEILKKSRSISSYGITPGATLVLWPDSESARNPRTNP